MELLKKKIDKKSVLALIAGISAFVISTDTGKALLSCDDTTEVWIKCDAIEGNQSEVKHVTFLVFYLIEVLIRRGTFSPNPT